VHLVNFIKSCVFTHYLRISPYEWFLLLSFSVIFCSRYFNFCISGVVFVICSHILVHSFSFSCIRGIHSYVVLRCDGFWNVIILFRSLTSIVSFSESMNHTHDFSGHWKKFQSNSTYDIPLLYCLDGESALCMDFWLGCQCTFCLCFHDVAAILIFLDHMILFLILNLDNSH